MPLPLRCTPDANVTPHDPAARGLKYRPFRDVEDAVPYVVETNTSAVGARITRPNGTVVH